MNIQLNTLATDRLFRFLGDKPGHLKLFYDVEDCGCNGVLVIQIVDAPYPTDIAAQGEPFSFLVDAKQEPLFDDVMRLEADAEFPVFKLTSDSALFSSHIRIQDIRM